MIDNFSADRNFTFKSGGVLAVSFALIVFILFGSYGFNPTDEGLFLPIARRIFEGQTPYTDFIWVRPILSPILYMPLVYFGGDYVLLISRLIAYLQYMTIIWLSVWMLREELAPHSSTLIYYFSIIIAFPLTSSIYFFYFVFVTLDGVFFLVVGLALLQNRKTAVRFLGYLFIGAACLTKQVFIITIPFFLFILKDWRDWRMIVAVLLPGTLYVTYLIINSAFTDALFQLTAISGNYDRLYISIFRLEVAAGIIIGYIIGLVRISKDIRERYIAIALSILLLIWMMKMRAAGDDKFFTLVPFGVVLSFLATRLYFDRIFMRKTALLLVVSWASSISYSVSFPIWMSGSLGVAALFAVIADNTELNKKFPKNISQDQKQINNRIFGKIKIEWIVATMMVVFLAIFIEQRLNKIPREKKFSLITTPLDGKFPGAAGIKTSASMVAVYEELKDMVKFARNLGKRYAILPELSAYWIVSEESNPLIMDSTYHVELGDNNPELLNRLVKNVYSLRKDTVFIVQKFTAEHMNYDKPGVIYLKDAGERYSQSWLKYRFAILGFIQDKFQLLTENKFFWMYHFKAD